MSIVLGAAPREVECRGIPPSSRSQPEVLQQFLKDGGVVMLLIPSREEERDRFPCCPLGQPPKIFYLVPYHKLVPVAARKRIPLLQITVKPFAQGRGRGEIPSPLVYPCSDPFNPLRPDTINEDPDSICQFRRGIHALDPDHVTPGSWSNHPKQRKERPSFHLDGLSCFGPLNGGYAFARASCACGIAGRFAIISATSAIAHRIPPVQNAT